MLTAECPCKPPRPFALSPAMTRLRAGFSTPDRLVSCTPPHRIDTGKKHTTRDTEAQRDREISHTRKSARVGYPAVTDRQPHSLFFLFHLIFTVLDQRVSAFIRGERFFV